MKHINQNNNSQKCVKKLETVVVIFVDNISVKKNTFFWL